MKELYIECNMGAAGDMLMAALSELHPAPDEFIKKLNSLGIPDVYVTAEKTQKCGITGTHIRVSAHGIGESEDMHAHEHNSPHSHEHEHGHHHDHEHMHHHSHEHGHEHPHTGLADIENIILGLDVSDNVKKNAIAVYGLIAEAESHVHGCEIENIHFHEVGTLDAVTDVVGVCMLIDELEPDKIYCSPVHVGSGNVRCAHGILPVPAPATAHILRGVPIYGGTVHGELCTPTGAALLKHFVEEFGDMPVMNVSKIGYGMGTKNFECANCVRVLFGETSEKKDEISELCCNIDDMTGEQIGFTVNVLFKAGALDVYTTPIGMKKNRPAVLLTCMCRHEQRQTMLELIFRHTSTIGVREYSANRYVLERHEVTLKTDFGNIRGKESYGYGVRRIKAEYDDIAEIAEKNGVSVNDIKWSE